MILFFSFKSQSEEINRSSSLKNYFKQFPNLGRNYFNAYAYDTMWSLAHYLEKQIYLNNSNTETFRNAIEEMDFFGATVKNSIIALTHLTILSSRDASGI